MYRRSRDADKRLLTPDSRRKAVSWAIEMMDYFQRRACAPVGIAPRVFHYQSIRPDDAVL
jgi:hypothetical protein